MFFAEGVKINANPSRFGSDLMLSSVFEWGYAVLLAKDAGKVTRGMEATLGRDRLDALSGEAKLLGGAL